MNDISQKQIFSQEVAKKGNPTGPEESGLAYQIIDESGKPVGEPKTGITYDVIEDEKNS